MRRAHGLVRGSLGPLVAGVLLAGCGAPSSPVTRSGESTTPPPPTSTVAAGDLATQKAAAGIADCPASDATVPADPKGLPDITLPCLGGGKEVRLAGLRGTPMVINVWAQWCPPCRQEAPHLTEASQQFGDRVLFLGIDIADPLPDRAIAFADEAGWTYPQVADEDSRVKAPFQLTGPPMTLLVTADGTIAYRHSGMITSTEQLQQLIEQHLGVD